jgi:hypothetical protein
LGVEKFYNIKEKEIPAYATIIRSKIEKDLFNEWATGGDGKKSIMGIDVYLIKLIAYNVDRIKQFETNHKSLSEKLRKNEEEISKKIEKWIHIGLGGKILGKRNTLFEEYLKLLENKYILKTTIRGYEYATLLMPKINEQLYDLYDDVDKFKQNMMKALEKIDKNINNRLADDPQKNTISSGNYKMYDPKNIRSITKNLTTSDKVKCEGATLKVRQAIIDITKAKEPHYFDKLRELGIQQFIECFEKQCNETAKKALENIQNKKVLGVNVLEKIKQEQGDSDELKKFIMRITEGSENFALFSGEETGKDTNNKGTLLKSAVLLLPEYDDDFRKEFETMFKNNWKGGGHVEVAKNNRPDEIIILTATTCFPLRYLSTVKYLQTEYNARCADTIDGYKHKIFMHTEDEKKDNEKYVQYPSLFMPTAPQKEDCAPYILIAMTMGIVIVEEIEDGRHKYYKSLGANRPKKNLGIEKFYNFSKEENDKFSDDIVKEIIEEVEKNLRTSRNEELGKLQTNLEEGEVHKLLLSECGNDKSKSFQLIDGIRQNAISILKKYKDE